MGVFIKEWCDQDLKMWFVWPGTLFLHNSQSALTPMEKESLALLGGAMNMFAEVFVGDACIKWVPLLMARRLGITAAVWLKVSIGSSSSMGVGSLLRRK